MNTVNNTTQTSLDSLVVAYLGESLTKGEVSYDWIADLQSRPAKHFHPIRQPRGWRG
jgi:ribonuclease D